MKKKILMLCSQFGNEVKTKRKINKNGKSSEVVYNPSCLSHKSGIFCKTCSSLVLICFHINSVPPPFRQAHAGIWISELAGKKEKKHL